jgi:ComF family protein
VRMSWTSWVGEQAQTMMTLLFPTTPEIGPLPPPLSLPYCQQCGEPHEGDLTHAYTCTQCAERSWVLRWARAAYRMQGPIRSTILRCKYEGQFHLFPVLTDWLEEGFRRHAAQEAWDALVSVPLHHVRARDRGFNQAAELAERLGRRQGLPHWSCLRRPHPTPKQATLSRSARLRNLRQAFTLKSRFDVAGKALLLIDDVYTTGATAEACARVLQAAGACRVAVLTVARA